MSQPGYPAAEPLSPIAREKTDDGAITFLRLVNTALRHLGLIVGTALLIAAVTAILTLRSDRSYTADASFVPQGSRAPSTASALAAYFGIGTIVPEGGQSPQFYVDLINSREILRDVVRSNYTVPTDSGTISGNLTSLLPQKARTERARELGAMRELKHRVSASTSQKTGVISLRVTSPHPALSSQIVATFLDKINEFNLVGRQSRASAERRFTEDRLREAATALAQAENRLEEFLRTNRDFRSPTLALQRERLNRTVLMRQQLHNSLAEAYEQARIEEIRDTPALTVIERPEPPLEPDPRGTVTRTAKALIFGTLIGLFLAFFIEFLRRSSARESDVYRELVVLSRNRLRGPFRRKQAQPHRT